MVFVFILQFTERLIDKVIHVCFLIYENKYNKKYLKNNIILQTFLIKIYKIYKLIMF